MIKATTERLQRIFLETLGWVLIVLGFAGLLLPGPGVLIMLAGLLLLSQQYDWAKRRVAPMKRQALRAAHESVSSWHRVVGSLIAALTLIVLGSIWIKSPPVPAWWPFADIWWLPGGWATGLTQIVSGAFAVVVIIWSYTRFRDLEPAAAPD